jgi:uncharacterized protein YkwD
MATVARRTRARLAALAVPVLLIGLLAGCLDNSEKSMLDALNAVRASSGRPALAVSDAVSERAQAWAETLAAEGRLRHSDLKRLPVPFLKAGENVAKASSVEQASQLFAASAPHRANIVDPAYTHVGIGVARGGDGAIYAVEIFVRQ